MRDAWRGVIIFCLVAVLGFWAWRGIANIRFPSALGAPAAWSWKPGFKLPVQLPKLELPKVSEVTPAPKPEPTAAAEKPAAQVAATEPETETKSATTSTMTPLEKHNCRMQFLLEGRDYAGKCGDP